MSDRGSSEPVKSPKYLDLKDFVGSKNPAPLQLRAPDGRRVWRSLDELANTSEFRDLMNREFPKAAAEWDDNVSRRNFIKLMGASLALAGLTTACAPKPEEKIIPYVQTPENLTPGKPLFYASTMPWGGFGKGVLVEQHEGRPTKIEGNPDHPASLGASDVWGQGSVLNLYDPDRAKFVTRNGNPSTWNGFITAANDAATFEDWGSGKSKRRSKPAKIAILTETVTSPTTTALIEALKSGLGDSVSWYAHDAVGRSNTRAGVKQAFGDDLTAVYNFAAAATVVTFDCNFLTEEPGSLTYAKDFISSRRVRLLGDNPRPVLGNRLYAVESTPTIVGALADHTARVKPQQVHEFAIALHKAIIAGKADGIAPPDGTQAGKDNKDNWFGPLVTELLKNKGKSLVIAGEYAPVEVHVLAHAINVALGNIATNPAEFKPIAHRDPSKPEAKAESKPAEPKPAEVAAAGTKPAKPEEPEVDPVGQGKPIALIPLVETSPADTGSIVKLVNSAKAGDVDVLLILGGNPAYSAPADADFEAFLKGIYAATGQPKLFVGYLGMFEDETARLCEWHIPETHWLEAWGDLRAYDGTASIVQPLIAPLYPAAKGQIEVLATLLQKLTEGKPVNSPAAGSTSPYEVVRSVWQAWQKANGGGEFEDFWSKSVHDGVIAKSAYPVKPFAIVDSVAKSAYTVPPAPGLTLNIRPDPNIWDGHLANNAWLQELPRPLTKITWDNALLISPKAAAAMGFASDDKGHSHASKYTEANGKTVDLSFNGKTIKGVPVWVLPGHPDQCATLYLGFGRRFAGRVGSPTDGQVGFDVNPFRLAEAPVATGTTQPAVATGPKPSWNGRWVVNNVVIDSTNSSKYAMAVTQNHQVITTELNHKRELVATGYNGHEVVAEYAEETAKREGVDLKPLTTKEEKEAANLSLARKIGLPILPDDSTNSSAGMFAESPDQTAGATRDNSYAAWGMIIDQTACIGCQACVMACNAENNVPVVGKEQVINEREMHWLRIDTYYVGDGINGSEDVDITKPKRTYFQPLPCMQCEKAPCELVCPVGATVHSKEGLNDMAYNRCVGTRYCSNNCPYKVRRFNFLKYVDDSTPVLKLLRNPEVTVRARGVMEKCTYCVQRISKGRIEAKKEEVKLLANGASKEAGLEKYNQVLSGIKTACQQSCPTEAIIFGNMADPKSKISQLKKEPVGFHYGLLADLNTRPRTTYFARIYNELPELRPHEEHDAGHPAEKKEPGHG